MEYHIFIHFCWVVIYWDEYNQGWNDHGYYRKEHVRTKVQFQISTASKLENLLPFMYLKNVIFPRVKDKFDIHARGNKRIECLSPTYLGFMNVGNCDETVFIIGETNIDEYMKNFTFL